MARPPKELEITEKPVPLVGWPGDAGVDRLRAIEQDIRDLMRQLAEARHACAESERQHADHIQQILLSVVETVDAFDRVFRNILGKEDQITPQMKIWLGNFRTVRRLLEKLLGEEGVVKIENLDQGFDPHWHKAAEVVVDPSRPEGTIVEEIQKGYLWRNKLLRKAEVIVVRHTETEEASDTASEPS